MSLAHEIRVLDDTLGQLERSIKWGEFSSSCVDDVIAGEEGNMETSGVNSQRHLVR